MRPNTLRRPNESERDRERERREGTGQGDEEEMKANRITTEKK